MSSRNAVLTAAAVSYITVKGEAGIAYVAGLLMLAAELPIQGCLAAGFSIGDMHSDRLAEG